MRMIDADALLETLNKEKIPYNADVNYFIMNAPTAVEIVRCRDCKWWIKDDNDPYGYCMAMKHGYWSANWEIGIYRKYKGDFYCADGERIEDEVEE